MSGAPLHPLHALKVRGLEVSVPGADGPFAAVRGVDLEVRKGETLAIVGESGSGKTLTALALAGLLPEGVHVSGGEIALLGENVGAWTEAQWRAYRGRRIGMVFQDPMTALNPVHTVGEQIAEAILAHRNCSRREARDEALALLARVELSRPERWFAAWPHQLSGGMRQRVQIAIAIANRPDVLIADEPTTALDATVQADILALLRELQRETGMALVMITHDLRLVARWSEHVIVMYAGQPVEAGRTSDVLAHPSHPYTRALLSARPQRRAATGPRMRLAEIPGRVPNLERIGTGCAFAGRCALATAHCESVRPDPSCTAGHTVWCHALSEAATVSRREACA